MVGVSNVSVVRHLLQKHARGCGVAALAMLTGHDYDDIARWVGAENLDERGIYLHDLDFYLFEHGYALQRRFLFGGYTARRQTTPWPPKPFADVHLCEVQVAESSPVHHFVVMLDHGAVLDPLTTEPRRLDSYHQVLNVAGVYRVDDSRFDPAILETNDYDGRQALTTVDAVCRVRESEFGDHPAETRAELFAGKTVLTVAGAYRLATPAEIDALQSKHQ